MDRTTFDRLVLEHLAAAQRFAIRLTGDPSAAEDLMQDALLKAHRARQTFRGQSKFTTWLFQIVVNCFRDGLDRQKARGACEPIGEEIEQTIASPGDEAQAKELGAQIAAAVSKLPPRQREVLVLSAYEGLSIGEIARVLSMSEQNVRTTLYLARERLKSQLSRYLGIAK